MAKCGAECEVYSRVCGYHRPVKNWNKGKQEEFKERKTFKVAVRTAGLAAVLCLLTGCGHNALQYSDGVGLEVGFVPDQYTLAVNFRYGKIFSAVVKEKTEIALKTEAKTAAGTGAESVSDTGVTSMLTLKTGDQTTGYVVDLERVKAGGK